MITCKSIADSKNVPLEVQIRIIQFLDIWTAVFPTDPPSLYPPTCCIYKVHANVTPYALTSKTWARELRFLFYSYCSVLKHIHATAFLQSICTSAVGSYSGGQWISVLDFGFSPHCLTRIFGCVLTWHFHTWLNSKGLTCATAIMIPNLSFDGVKECICSLRVF